MNTGRKVFQVQGSDRYIRQIPLINREGQERLSRATVFIAGAGGLASPVATYLALAGVGEIIIADGDRVEESNFNRQFLHSTRDQGKQKAYSAISTLNLLNPEISLVAIPEFIDEKNAGEIVKDADIIIDAVDSYKTRFLLNRIAHSHGIPLVHGAIEGFGGQVTTIIPGQTPCIACLIPDAPPVRTVPVIGAAAGVIGSIQAMEAIKLITGIGKPFAGELFIWDGLCGRTDLLPFKNRPDCPVCGKQG